MGYDPYRHGRFIIIVDRRKIAFKKQRERMLLELYPVSAIRYLIPTIFITIGSVLEVKKCVKACKFKKLGLTE